MFNYSQTKFVAVQLIMWYFVKPFAGLIFCRKISLIFRFFVLKNSTNRKTLRALRCRAASSLRNSEIFLVCNSSEPQRRKKSLCKGQLFLLTWTPVAVCTPSFPPLHTLPHSTAILLRHPLLHPHSKASNLSPHASLPKPKLAILKIQPLVGCLKAICQSLAGFVC